MPRSDRGAPDLAAGGLEAWAEPLRTLSGLLRTATLRYMRSKLLTVPTLAGAALAALTVLGWSGAATATADPAPPVPSPAPAPPAAPKTVIDHDGQFAVGTDIAPGVYASAGPVGEGTCSWRRVAAAPAGQTGETIDRAFTHQAQVVQIDASDGTFKTTGCQTWQLTDQAPPAPGTSPLLAGLQLKGYLDSLNRNAAQYNATHPDDPVPAPQGTGPAPGPASAPTP